jgi:hypothetical protein
MKRNLLVILLVIISSSMWANSIEKIFVTIPDEFYMFQTNDARGDLVKAYKNGDTLGVKNRFGGKSLLIELNDEQNYLKVRNTSISTLEMKLWHTSAGTDIVGVNIVTCVPLCDSNVGFFTDKWQYVKDVIFPKVTLTDFLDTDAIAKDGKKLEAIIAAFNMAFFQYSFLKENTDILVELHVDTSKEGSNYDSLKQYLKGTKITFVWQNDTFQKSGISW